jgi:leucyl-tRNA synthetase
MEAVNGLYKLKEELEFSKYSDDWRATISQLVLLLAPFTPHLSEELWSELGNDGSVLSQTWPTWDETALVTNEITVIVQINGKLRAQLSVEPDLDEAALTKLAKEDIKVAEHLKGKSIVKSIFVKNKLVNFVVK